MKGINMSTFSGSDNDQYTESELQKAFPADKYRIISDEGMAAFHQDLDKLIKKGESSVLLQEEVDAIEKGKRDAANGWQKIYVTRSDGVRTAKWAKIKEAEPGKSLSESDRKDLEKKAELAITSMVAHRSYAKKNPKHRDYNNEMADKYKAEYQKYSKMLGKEGKDPEFTMDNSSKKDAEKETGIVNEVDQPHKTAMNNLHKKVTGEDTKATSKNKITVPKKKVVVNSILASQSDLHGKEFEVIDERTVHMASGSHKVFTIKDSDGNPREIMEDQIKQSDKKPAVKIKTPNTVNTSMDGSKSHYYPIGGGKDVHVKKDGDKFTVQERSQSGKKVGNSKEFTSTDTLNDHMLSKYGFKTSSFDHKDISFQRSKTSTEKGYSPDLQKAFSVLNITK